MMLQAQCLSEAKALRHGFFTREGGVSSSAFASLNCGYSGGDLKDKVDQNRAIVMAALALPAVCLRTVKQVHGTGVHLVEDRTGSSAAFEADALVTHRPGIALGVLSADCAPVLIADIEAGVVGAVHASWRCSLAGLIGKTVDVMLKQGAAKGRLRAAVGPCIGKASYEVGPDMQACFAAVDPDALALFRPKGHQDRMLFDLKAYVLLQLQRAGVESREALENDTVAEEDRFFSARRSRNRGEQRFGLQLSVIAWTGQAGQSAGTTSPAKF